MLGGGECQTEHRHVQQINRDHCHHGHRPIRADGTCLSRVLLASTGSQTQPARIFAPMATNMATVGSGLEAATRALFDLGDQFSADFLRPAGEAALVSPDSVSWRVFKNPLSLFIGGVAAVILELAEPRVRTGVWEHTTFRTDPIRRLRRTGLAAIVTIYGTRGKAEAMIARIRRMHDRVAGLTPAGAICRANEPGILSWVQA